MPLRDHFRPPDKYRTYWECFHAQWPALIVMDLNRRLPERYFAGPRVHSGKLFEVDVATFQERDWAGEWADQAGSEGSSVAVWAPPRPTLAVSADLLDVDQYEVLVHDADEADRLVAAIEIVSPANKDRPEHRRVFVAKCAAMVQSRVCVMIVDIVTTRSSNLYAELLEQLGERDPSLADGPPALHAVACRWSTRNDVNILETWSYPLELGRELPVLPLWLSDDLALPLDLEASYQETARSLRIPRRVTPA